MIRLHVFAEPWGFNPSPFCLKVQIYCRLAGISFVSVPALPIRAPKGKLPFLSDGDERVADSGVIIDYLKGRFGNPLDGDLDARQSALGHLIRRTCEESLYFVLLYSRWIDPDGWKVIKPAFFGPMPPLLRDAVATMAQRRTRRALHGQGTGRHTADEVYALGAADLGAIATIIARQDFAVAGHPTSFDAALYGFLANILKAPVETPLKQEARRHGALTAYVARMDAAVARASK